MNPNSSGENWNRPQDLSNPRDPPVRLEDDYDRRTERDPWEFHCQYKYGYIKEGEDAFKYANESSKKLRTFLQDRVNSRGCADLDRYGNVYARYEFEGVRNNEYVPASAEPVGSPITMSGTAMQEKVLGAGGEQASAAYVTASHAQAGFDSPGLCGNLGEGWMESGSGVRAGEPDGRWPTACAADAAQHRKDEEQEMITPKYINQFFNATSVIPLHNINKMIMNQPIDLVEDHYNTNKWNAADNEEDANSDHASMTGYGGDLRVPMDDNEYFDGQKCIPIVEFEKDNSV